MRSIVALILGIILALAGASAEAYLHAEGSYTVGATATDNRDITISPSFQPTLVVIKCNAAQEAVWTIPGLGADQTTTFSNTAAVVTNRIQAFNANGFQVGTSTAVQTTNSTCYYAAFANDSHNDFTVGTYTGNGSDSRNIIISPAFQPGLVWIHPSTDVAQAGVWRSAAHTGDDSSRFAGTSPNITNAIQAFNADGFQVGTHATVNSNAVVYAYVAFKSIPTFNDSGSFTGNTAVDNRDITTIANPTFVFLHSAASSSSAYACMRFGGIAGDASWSVQATAATTDQIQALTSTGFQLGTSICVNHNAQTLYWWAMKAPTYQLRRHMRAVRFQ
jgi:hypothetical protein